MAAIIKSALPSANGTEAFTFSIIANVKAKANPEKVQKWQNETKKFGLKTFRDIGIEKNNYNSDATNKDIAKASELVFQCAIYTSPNGVSVVDFHAYFTDPEDVMELLELDQTFLDKF